METSEKAKVVREHLLDEVAQKETEMVDLVYEIYTDETMNIFAKEKAGKVVVEYAMEINGARELIKTLDAIIMSRS